MISVKRGRPLITLVSKLVRAVKGRITNSDVRVVISFLSHCSQLCKNSGLRFLCIYLKAQYVNLQQSVAGNPLFDLTPLGVRFSRNGSGLPRCIPILHRMWIRKGSSYHIRIWLSLFSLYRVIEFQGRIKLATITDPFSGTKSMNEILPEFSAFVCGPFRRSLEKEFLTDWLYDAYHDRRSALRSLIIKPFAIASSTPVAGGSFSTSFSSLILTLHAWRYSSLLPLLRDWMKITTNTRFLNWFEEGLEYSKSKLGTTYSCLPLGKLGLKDEAAGKIRVFAMVDCVTQWIFNPLHKRLFEILRKIPQDGTHDQSRPLEHLSTLGKEGYHLDSFDLSAATDRLPVLIQATLLSSLIGSWPANIWMSLLISRDYTLPESAREDTGLESVTYAVGQPMGALTSWAMLAITHHTIVQWAAYKAKVILPGGWFSDYAVLGDDIVIANVQVSKSYIKILEELGVQVGLAKSLKSDLGALEFAKRFIVGGVNLSPVPIVELVAAQRSLAAAVEAGRKFNLTPASLAGLLGFGYRAVGSINGSVKSLGSRLRTLLLATMAPKPGSGGMKEYLSYNGTSAPTVLESSAIQGYRDSFATSILKKIDDLQPRLNAIKQLVTVDRTRAHYGTIDFPEDSVDLFLSHFVSILKDRPKGDKKKIKRGPTRYCSNFYFRNELGPVSTDVSTTISEMRKWMTPSDRRFVMTLYEYVYREMYLDTLSEISQIRSTLEDVNDFTLEELENTIERLDSIDSDLSAVATFPRTGKRMQPKVKTNLKMVRSVRMWKHFNTSSP